jgi:hypothetical protein
VTELSTTLAAIGIALGTIVLGILGVVAVHAPKLVKTLLEIAQQRLESLRVSAAREAVATGVATADEAGHTYLAHDANKSAAKMQIALNVARAQAPRATASLPEPQLTELVQAAVSQRRASLPNPSLMPPSLAPGSVLSIPVQVLTGDSIAPTHPPASLPKPARMPTLEDLPTPDPRSRPRPESRR